MSRIIKDYIIQMEAGTLSSDDPRTLGEFTGIEGPLLFGGS